MKQLILDNTMVLYLPWIKINSAQKETRFFGGEGLEGVGFWGKGSGFGGFVGWGSDWRLG